MSSLHKDPALTFPGKGRKKKRTFPQIDPRYLRIPQAAIYLGYQEKTVYRLVEEKRIPHIRKGRTLFFDRMALDKWMQEDLVNPLPVWNN